MGRIFDVDGPFLSGLTKVADIVILNVLFIICSIPVFTIGASFTAMYYVTLKMVKDEECYTVKSFFKSFAQNFKQATAIWLIMLVAGGVLVMDLRIMNGAVAGIEVSGVIAGVMSVLIIAADVLFLFILTYVFPVLSRFDNTVKATLYNSLMMSIRHLPQTVIMIIVNIIPLVLMYYVPATLILVFVVFGLTAYIDSFLFVKIFSRYMPKEEITKDEDFTISVEKNNEENKEQV